MSQLNSTITKNIKYLQMLAKQYPTVQGVCTEIINLRAILNLPKGTEHFMSDLHGEYEAFTHILNNSSGVIREKVDILYANSLSIEERAGLCTLIYYPAEKLAQVKKYTRDLDRWYETTLLRLIDVCKIIASKYTRSKVRKVLPKDFAYIIDELLHADYNGENQSLYYLKIMESILALNNADGFIEAISTLIKLLSVDRLHIVGDIFDRGPRPDLIMDMLVAHHSVDVQWGNHDILWMGAATGNTACIAVAVSNCAAFGNLQVLEQGYGINLRPLALFAEKTYEYSPQFAPRIQPTNSVDKTLAGKIYKAMAIIALKLEGQLIQNNPQFDMSDRLLLDKIDMAHKTVTIDGVVHPLQDSNLPTLIPSDPYALTAGESAVMQALCSSFRHSERLHGHVSFLYSNGSMYTRYNQNLLYHGCVPMEKDGSFTVVELDGERVSGKTLLDKADAMARRVYLEPHKCSANASDIMWYLWCGKDSPIFGREKMTTFERLFVADKTTWAEQKDCYYQHILNEDVCVKILEEFQLPCETAHIINGHVPVKVTDGENPVKGGGKLIVIDGGFCKAYQSQTGIAGYTLIYNSYGLRLSAHMPFESIESAVQNNVDIHSTTTIFEVMEHRMQVMDTDAGQTISEKIFDLSLLLEAYRNGIIPLAAK